MTAPGRPGPLPGSTLGAARAVADLSPRRLLPAAAAGAASAACGVGLLATSAWLITRAALRPPVLSLSIAIGLVQAFALGRGVTRYLQRLCVHDVALGVLGRLRLRLFDTLEPLVPGGLGPGGTGQALSAVVSDTEQVAAGLARTLTATVDVAGAAVLGTAVTVLVDPGAGAVLGAGAAAVIGVALGMGRLGRSHAEAEAEGRAALARTVVETTRTAPELVAFGRHDLVDERLDAVARQARRAAVRGALVAGAGRALVGWTAGAALVAVVVAGLMAHDGGHLSGVALAVVAFVALAVLEQCSALAPALADGGGGAARRLAAVTALAPPVREPVRDGAGRALPPCGVELARATVTAGEHTILDAADLVVAPGRRVAVTGPSGAGKSTVLHTLLHFVECRDGTARLGGVDVRTMTRASIAGHVGWVGETTHVFADSVTANLRLARPDAGEADCRRALKTVGLGPWLAGLPDGLLTVLGAGGRPMSAGERQRLGLARALLGGGSVLLLDEPAAHIDAPSAAPLLRAVTGARPGGTVVLVSHDPAATLPVDTVVHVDAGHVTVVGGPPPAP
ncbi:MAG TPA: thiol reductant ABC exporter subunit CydC [Acidimicrobiales bacterium]|nr:thiol reductant ABC exporter subunit CydC [Acidimicrobiales bacterium]